MTAKTIIAIPMKASSARNIDNIVECIRHNISDIDRGAFKLVIDTNGMTEALNRYLQTVLRPLHARFDIELFTHTEADGRTGSMNRIARHALESEPDLNGIIYIADDIILAPGALAQVAQALEKHPVAGGMVKPLDQRTERDTTLAEQAILDFESRVRKKTPHLHGSFMGIAKAELERMAPSGFFPPVHFDDNYLTVRYKMQHGTQAEPPVLTDCEGFIAMPSTWAEAINKVSRYHGGDLQLADYFTAQGHTDIASVLREMTPTAEKAIAQFTKALQVAQGAAQGLPPGKSGPDIDYLMEVWQQVMPPRVEGVPDAEAVREVLERLIAWDPRKEACHVARPEVVLPLLNSIINLLGRYKFETGHTLAGSSWERDGQAEVTQQAAIAQPLIRSAVPAPAIRQARSA